MSQTQVRRRGSVILTHLSNLSFAFERQLARCSVSSPRLLVQIKEINVGEINVAIR